MNALTAEHREAAAAEVAETGEKVRRFVELTYGARACAVTIRLKLLKIGAVILINTRRVQFLLASNCPNRDLYFLVAKHLAGG